MKCNALPDKLHRVICTAPLASADCTNCIPCLDKKRQRKASVPASARKGSSLSEQAWKVSPRASGESGSHNTSHWCCSLKLENNSLPPAHFPSFPRSMHAHTETQTHTHRQEHAHPTPSSEWLWQLDCGPMHTLYILLLMHINQLSLTIHNRQWYRSYNCQLWQLKFL